MTITNHLLNDALQQRLKPAGTEMATRRFLVMHYTAGLSAQSSIDWWKDPRAKGASAHVIIERDGTIIQCRAFNERAGHAGVSAWVDPNTGERYDMINKCSIGIELANAGSEIKNGKLFGRYPGDIVSACHKWEPDRLRPWEEFPPAQISAAFALAALLVRTYNLDDVIGHEDCAPPGLRANGDWKPDPGPLFPMTDLRRHCGMAKPLARLTP